MNNNINLELDKEKNNFLTLTKRIPQIYSQYKINPIEEYTNNFETLEKQLNNSFSNLYLIKNKILKTSDEIALQMLEQDAYISEAEKIKEKQNNILNLLQDKGGASQPREVQTQKMFYVEGSLLFIQSLFLLGYGYLFYNLFTN